MIHVILERMIQSATNGGKAIFLIVLMGIAIPSFAQEHPVKDSLYLVTYTTGPSWDIEKSPNDQVYFSDHSKHLAELRKNGTIKLGARAGEKGIIVFSAKTLQKAREIINNDIAIINGLFETEIQPFHVFYPGCVDR